MVAKKTVSVIERRLQGPSALYNSSLPIPTKEKGWKLRWENSEIRPDQVWHFVNTLGWEYAAVSDIACTLEEIGANERETRVVRGVRGQEVLLKIREADFKKIQQKKSQENIDITFSRGKVKTEMMEQVAGAHGAEAADFIGRTKVTELVDSRTDEG